MINSDRIRFDMHVHSQYSSDSTIPIGDIVNSWKATGILPLVCDHNTIAGSVHVFHELRNRDPDIPKILTEEILTSDGEIIGLFLQDEIPAGMSAEETLDEIRDQAAISIVPHPFCSFRSSVIRHDVLDRIINRVDIIEGFNGRAVVDQDNLLARRFAAKHKKPVSAGSDSHSPGELGKIWVEIEPISCPADMVRALCSAEIHFRRSLPVSSSVNRMNPPAGDISGIVS